MALATFTAQELARLGGFSYSNQAANAVATKLNAVASEVTQANPSAPVADTVSSAAGPVTQAFATKVTIPAGALAAGSRLTIKAAGSCTLTGGAVNCSIAVKLGSSTVASVAAFDPAAGSPFVVDAMLVVQSAGALGKFNACYMALSKTATPSTVIDGGSQYQGSVDTTASNDVTVVVTWAAGAGETVRLNVLSVDLTY